VKNVSAEHILNVDKVASQTCPDYKKRDVIIPHPIHDIGSTPESEKYVDQQEFNNTRHSNNRNHECKSTSQPAPRIHDFCSFAFTRDMESFLFSLPDTATKQKNTSRPDAM
jgi:hypothetical protein